MPGKLRRGLRWKANARGLSIDHQVAQGLRAAWQEPPGIDLPLPDAAIVLHSDGPADQLRLAGAAQPIRAGRRNSDALPLGEGEHGLPGRDLDSAGLLGEIEIGRA